MTSDLQLTDEQREILSQRVPLLAVMAGAGTGKTTLMTHYIAHAIRQGWVRPQDVLAVSFTQLATQTLRERLAKLLDQQPGVAQQITTQTFDSFTYQQLSADNGWLAQVSTHIHLHLQDDATAVLGDSYHLLQADKTNVNLVFAMRQFTTFQKFYKYVTDRQRVKTERDAMLRQIAAYYNKALLDRACAQPRQDIDWYATFTSQYDMATQVLQQLANAQRLPAFGFKLMIIDEVQDLGVEKIAFLQLLHQLYPHVQMVMIGDVAQSIYRFNQADPNRLMQFLHTEHAVMRSLTQNFRSQAGILPVPNLLLRHNFDNNNATNIQLHTQIPAQPHAMCFLAPGYANSQEPRGAVDDSDLEQQLHTAAYVVAKWHERHIPYEQMAILVPTNFAKERAIQWLRYKNATVDEDTVVSQGYKRLNSIKAAIKIITALDRVTLHQAYGQLVPAVPAGVRRHYARLLTSESKSNYTVNVGKVLRAAQAYLCTNNGRGDWFSTKASKAASTYNKFVSDSTDQVGTNILQQQSVRDIQRWASETIRWLTYAQDGINDIIAKHSRTTQQGVVVETMHAAKGTEYPYVIVVAPNYNPDDERMTTFPWAYNMFSMKRTIDYQADIAALVSMDAQLNGSKLPTATELATGDISNPRTQAVLRRWHDQQDLMYVALTRARQQCVVVTSDRNRRYIDQYYRQHPRCYDANTIPLECLIGAGYTVDDRTNQIIDQLTQ